MYYFSLVPQPLAFRGYGEYMIESRMEGDGVGTWVWYDSITNTTMATLNKDEHTHFPFGRLMWDAKVNKPKQIAIDVCNIIMYVGS